MTNENNADAFCVYAPAHAEDEHDAWMKIGVAVPHSDGNGFSISLKVLPLEGSLVLRKREFGGRQADSAASLARQVEAFERAVIEKCLLESGGRIKAVMERLDLPRRTLNEKMLRLGIDRHRAESNSKRRMLRGPRIGRE